jgi:hypothetical protein
LALYRCQDPNAVIFVGRVIAEVNAIRSAEYARNQAEIARAKRGG